MSIRSDYDPEAEHIKQVFASIETKLGPLWYFAKDEQTLISKLNLLMLTDEEKCYALDRYRKIKSGEYHNDPKPNYPPAVVAICVIVTIILFILGFCR